MDAWDEFAKSEKSFVRSPSISRVIELPFAKPTFSSADITTCAGEAAGRVSAAIAASEPSEGRKEEFMVVENRRRAEKLKVISPQDLVKKTSRNQRAKVLETLRPVSERLEAAGSTNHRSQHVCLSHLGLMHGPPSTRVDGRTLT